MTAIDPNAYQSWPIETEPTVLSDDAKVFLRSLPGWDQWSGDPANFDAALIEANALMAAEVRDLAANVPDGIFRRFGAIAGIYPQDAIPATLTATVTAADALGYTLEAGTVFGLRATGDTTYNFTVDTDTVIPVGDTVSAEFTLTAQEPGAGPNGLGGVSVVMPGPLDRTLPWLASAQTATTATGGQDAETTGDYLNHLVIELRLNRQLILPDDFASFAQLQNGVFRAVSIDRYIPGVNEVERISHNGTGGTLTLTYSGQTTAAIAWNASAADVQTALEALSNLAPGDVVVTGGPLPAQITVTFGGTLAWTNVTQITGTATSLTPGGRTITIATAVDGAAEQTDADDAVTTWVVDVNGQDPGATVRANVTAAMALRIRSGDLAAVLPPAYDSIDVVFTAQSYPGWDPADVQARAIQAVADFLSPATWGSVPFGETPIWFHDTTARLTELVEALNRVDGLWRLTGPGANGMPTIEGSSADHTLVGLGAVVLPTAGTISGTVTA